MHRNQTRVNYFHKIDVKVYNNDEIWHKSSNYWD